MKSKEYLQEIRKMNDDINKKIMDLHELKIISKSIPAINNGEKVQSSPNFDKIGTLIAKIDELEREIDRMTDVFVDRKNEAVDFIMLLDRPRDRDLIFRKYILFEKVIDFHYFSPSISFSKIFIASSCSSCSTSYLLCLAHALYIFCFSIIFFKSSPFIIDLLH